MTDLGAYALVTAADPPGPASGAVAIIRDGGGRLLLLLRDDRPDIVSPGVWSFPGGGIEPGETPQEAAAREMREELGIRVSAADCRPFARVQTGPPRKVQILVHRLTLDISPCDIVLGEGAGFAFFTPRQAESLPFSQPLKPVLQRYLDQRTSN